MESPRVIAIANLKGGVGKTCCSVNLAAGLVRRKKRVLLVDLDPQGHATASLGLAPHTGSLSGCLAGDFLATEVLVNRARGFDIIPASSDLPKDWAVQSRTSLAQVIAPIVQEYEFIVIDCPAGPTDRLSQALIAANWVLIPVVPQYLSISGVRQMLGLTAQIQQDVGQGAQLLGLVLSQVDNRLRVTQEVTELLKGYFKERVFTTVIPQNVALTEAPEFGQSIFEYSPKSTGAIAFGKLTRELLRRLD